MESFVTGLPGPQSAVTATHKIIFRDGTMDCFYGGGRVIDGTKSRDSGHSGDLNVLRPGLPMGKVTSSGKYAPSIMGLTDAAYASGTSLTLTVAAATELSRRVGSSGTFTIVGPPAASGVVATETVTYSAVNTTTGVVTVTALANDYIAGSFVMPTDGSQDIKTFIPDGWGVNVFLSSGSAADQPFSPMPIAGVLITANLLFYPSDASLKSWWRSQLHSAGEGKFILDDTL